MSKNKKPRKAYRPKPVERNPLFYLHRTAMQQSQAVMSRDQLTDLGLSIHSSLDVIKRGKGEEVDIHHMSMAANISMLLCESGLGPEHIEIAQAGQLAALGLLARWQRTGQILATGPQINALTNVIALHQVQIAHEDCTEARLYAVLGELDKRIRNGNYFDPKADTGKPSGHSVPPAITQGTIMNSVPTAPPEPGVIRPTIGRIVWYHPGEHDTMNQYSKDQALAAKVCYVWSDRGVNLSVTDHAGQVHARTSVKLLQADDVASEGEAYAEWMPYQLGQAKAQSAGTTKE